ncbi:MAG: hypothetical protein ACI83Q_000640 [Colwellia polaris]|jgi:hypothetical protein
MREVLQAFREKLAYIAAAVVGGVAVISYTVMQPMQLSEDLGDTGFDDSQLEGSAPKEISSQIDENTQKLQAYEDNTSSNSTDYRVLGC